MNAFLVIASGPADDIPLHLCGTWDDAVAFVGGLHKEDIQAEAGDVMGVTISEVVNVRIIPFRDGAPLPAKSAEGYLPANHKWHPG
jgi:hypothetical protein